ncbi:MAG: transcription termination/antitermination protein NusG [Actinomycetota bacterium]
MNPENENPAIEPALNGDEPSNSMEDVSVEPNGHEAVEPHEEAQPGPADEPPVSPKLEDEPAEAVETPTPEAPAAFEVPAEPEPQAEPAPVEPQTATEPEVVAAAATEAPAPAAPEAPAPEEPAAEEIDEPAAEDASSIAADIQQAIAAASATARASAEVAQRAAADAEIEVSVALAEPEPSEEVSAGGEGEEGEEESAAVARIFQPGDWFVVHTYAGYENKVKANLQSRITSMNMEEKIFEVTIPMEDVMEIKSGKKQVVQRKVFPGYLLVRMDLDDDSWYVVRNTPGVTGFVGSGTKPIPLSEREVDRILQRKAVGERPKPKLEWSLNDPVRVTTGPFANFQGLISEIDTDRSKLKVLVNIFGRETPVELGFDQVAKV